VRSNLADLYSWELNTKMLPTVWQALAQSKTLTKLTVKFPSKRNPRPIALVPPMPNLQYVKFHDIDPLCYSDDISIFFLGSKNLHHVSLHFSPRMRQTREPSIHYSNFFGKCDAANYLLPLKSIAVQNLYDPNSRSCGEIVDNRMIEEITFLNSTGGIGDDNIAVFGDNDWKTPNQCVMPTLKMLRLDKISHAQCDFLGTITGLERLYLIGPHAKPSSSTENSTNPIPTTYPRSPASSTSSPGSTDPCSILALKDLYLENITTAHGATLRHLLLPPQWRLSNDDIARIVRQCPNLEQLAIGFEMEQFKHMRLLVPFLSKLTALRMLGNPDDPGFMDKMRELDRQGLHEEKIGEETVNREWSRLRWIEMGDGDMLFEIGKRYQTEGGQWRREVKRRSREDVQGLEVWGLDCLDI